ncbi:glycosyltransferase family 2 protein [Nocardioides sp. Kera G14]|uniref:glycosyltransferase family 2 protein n=1 Tax=Nocardioides sp. Kera G14 TaxID=2884264 RepID=UPI001D10A308|nr:glycosyltransferase [Nocardioides sp. Kera G14]UDY24781.1 glycosyltransferase [Nocardioides sp. Kera G14]
MSPSARVTTVVATRNRAADLAWSLPLQQEPVIVVDNGSDDETVALVQERFPTYDVIALSENQGAVARNVGVSAATTPYVAFSDDDSWWDDGALERAAELFDAHPDLALIQARILVGPDERTDPVCEQMAHAQLGNVDDTTWPAILGFIACGSIVRREAFLAVGGFDPVVHFPGEEERVALDLAAAGWRMAYVDDVVCHHHPSTVRPPSAHRLALESRNRVLTAVMRRPWSVVAATIGHAMTETPAARRGVLDAVPRLPAALGQRRRLPVALERARRELDAAA